MPNWINSYIYNLLLLLSFVKLFNYDVLFYDDEKNTIYILSQSLKIFLNIQVLGLFERIYVGNEHLQPHNNGEKLTQR